MIFDGGGLKLQIRGSSHGHSVGMQLFGIPAGEHVDLSELQAFADRRKPSDNIFSTQRKEADKIVVNSGIKAGVTDGGVIDAEIFNTDAKSADYENLKHIPRPSHADYPAFVKYGGNEDMSGGGKFSGRLTAPLTIAGGIAVQILRRRGISIAANIAAIGQMTNEGGCNGQCAIDNGQLKDKDNNCHLSFVPCHLSKEMLAEIESAKREEDSVGGIIECVVLGVPAGLGDFMFDSFESRLSRLLFGIPALKGVEFGAGFDIAKMRGSEANDEYYYDNGEVKTKTNHNGGILGGLTTGMPVCFRVAIKPTPSIGKKQNSVDLQKRENCTLEIKGRHDACIVPRAVVVVEACAALAILDCMMTQ